MLSNKLGLRVGAFVLAMLLVLMIGSEGKPSPFLWPGAPRRTPHPHWSTRPRPPLVAAHGPPHHPPHPHPAHHVPHAHPVPPVYHPHRPIHHPHAPHPHGVYEPVPVIG